MVPDTSPAATLFHVFEIDGSTILWTWYSFLVVFCCCGNVIHLTYVWRKTRSADGAYAQSMRILAIPWIINCAYRSLFPSLYLHCTGIVHSVARLQSLYNVVISRSRALVTAAKNSPSAVVRDIFSESATYAFSAVGYNNLFGAKHRKVYSIEDQLCAAFIRDARSNPTANQHLQDDIYCIATL